MANLSNLSDLAVYRENRVDAHSDHIFYETLPALTKDDRTLYQSLDGKWDVLYAKSADEREADFYLPGYQAKGTVHKITVPSHGELAGLGQIRYINTMYPWEGKEMLRPPMVPHENTVLSYTRYFTLNENLKGKRVFIQFQGVEKAMYLYLNGKYVGYAEDSFTPSDFELTEYLKDGENQLSVEVFQHSKASWVEDQDFFRFTGIFRPVILYAIPSCHLFDIWAKTDWIDGRGTLSLRIKTERSDDRKYSVSYRLKDRNGALLASDEKTADEEMCFDRVSIEGIDPYSWDDPVLYPLLIEVRDENGATVECTTINTGYRHLEIRDKVIYLNGKRLIICGVNRHEWSPEKGRAIGLEEMKADIAILRRNHINSVRTCHYPDSLPWYSLCDENGIYLVAETDLESHGSWQKNGVPDPSWNVPGDDDEWTPLVLDRAISNFETFKNHPSILFWSLGNESYAGRGIIAMNEYFKQKDDTRLVHYEGVFWNPKLKSLISDVESEMYTAPDDIRKYFREDGSKPFLLCEYMHSMGNSLGGLTSYDALFDEFESYQGGWIWDFIDQALYVWKNGRRVLRYGGDFMEKATDYEFSANGIVFSDRSEKPAMNEVRHVYGNRLRRC